MDKELLLEVKSLEEAGTFEGYAAVFGNVDRQGDVIIPGAFKATLARKRKSLPLLWQHDQSVVIGKINEVGEDSHGLYVKGQLNLKVVKAVETYELIKSGDVTGMSIGYRVKNAKKENNSTVLTELELFEASIVSIPANESAEILTVKSDSSSDFAKLQEELTQLKNEMADIKTMLSDVKNTADINYINNERKESIKAYSEMLKSIIL